MKPKVFVGIAIMFSILVAGLILVIGLSSDTILPISLLIFLLLFFALTIYLTKDLLEDKVFVAIILLTLIALSATFFLTSLKTYHEVVNTFGDPNTAPEMQLMQSQNDYYYAYANYLNQRILEYQAKSKVLEAQLTGLQRLELEKQANNSSNTQAVTSTLSPEINPPETSYITYIDQEQNEGNDD